jgi:hypothetical protein
MDTEDRTAVSTHAPPARDQEEAMSDTEENDETECNY